MDSEELRWTEPNGAPQGAGTPVNASLAPPDRLEDFETDNDFDTGAKLGRYVVLSHMGGGGMGVVYAAYDPELDRRIALKLMHQRGNDERETERASRRMLAEAKAMAQLSHPNVITVHDVGTINERVFIAMEFVEGVPLSEWMREPGRDWQEQLDMFIRAGRGLEAAHAVGLVHRDFKPDNVLVGIDGRVRVLDFGLARRFDGYRQNPRETGEGRDREAGTPAYMSPEQHLGKHLDHRADQFSFCVALYEALYGELPFSAKTRLELALAVTDGRVGPAPKRASVPNWVRWALLRGLDPDPEGRWEDMASLLAALSHDPYHRYRVAALGTATVLMIAVVFAIVIKIGLANQGELAIPDSQPQCTRAEARVAAVWNGERSTLVREAFARADEPWAAEVAGEVEQGLTRWAANWTTMHRETCEASAVGEQSETMLDRRMLCLDRRLSEFNELVEVVTGAEVESFARVREAVRKLPDLGACEAALIDAESSAHVDPSTIESPKIQARVAQLERDLFRANSLEMAGAFAEAAKLAKAGVLEAEELGDPRLLARALLTQAQITLAQGDVRSATALLEEAGFAAERAQDDRLRGEILISLARADAGNDDADAATHRVREARAVLDRIGAGEVEYAALDGIAALASIAAGELGTAEGQARRGIGLVAQLEPAPVELAELRTTLGIVLRELGRYAEARTELERAGTLWAGHYGRQHPILATIRYELALVDDREGRHDVALTGFIDAIAVFQDVFGANSMDVAHASAAMAVTLGKLGRYDESLRRHNAARAIFRAHLHRSGDAASDALARALNNEGIVRRETGQFDEALSLHQRALAMLEPAEAVAPLSPRDRADRANVLIRLAEILLILERAPEGRDYIDEALALLSPAPGGTVIESSRKQLARARFVAARVWAEGEGADMERARSLGLEARGEYEAFADADTVAEIDRWLDQVPGGA